MIKFKFKKIISKIDDYGAVYNSIIIWDKKEHEFKREDIDFTEEDLTTMQELIKGGAIFHTPVNTLAVRYKYRVEIDLWLVEIRFSYVGKKWHKLS